MPRHYVHFQNGVTTLDSFGVDAPDLATIRAEAVLTIAAVLREDNLETLWAGAPLRLWVTTDPEGKGKPIFTLQITASVAEPS